MAPTLSTFVSPGVTSGLLSLESSLASHKSEKAFIVGPGHDPIPSLFSFVQLADLLSVNLCAMKQELQTFLDGKLVVSSSKRWCCAQLTLVIGPICPSISCLSFKRLVISLVQPG